ncbi:MAG: YfhO family protein [Acidobacteriota bacterium]
MPDLVALPLLYLATAAAALVATDRWVRPIARRDALVLALLPLCFTGEALLQGEVYAPIDMLARFDPFHSMAGEPDRDTLTKSAGDITFQIAPWHAAVRSAWASGDWPLWNPYMLAGDSLQQSAQSAPYFPPNLLALLLPFDLSLTYLAAINLLLAALAGFCWARELGCAPLSSLLGATAWTFGGFTISWVVWPMGMTIALFPLVLVGVRRIARDGSWSGFGILATSFSLVLLAGHPESVLHIAAAGAVLGVLEMAWRPARTWPRALALSVGGGLLAGAVSAIFLLPIIEALPQTANYHQRKENFAARDHSVPWPQAVERATVQVVPFAYGTGWREAADDRPRFFLAEQSAYIGSAFWILAIYGLIRHPWRGRWGLAAAVAIGVALGAGAPGITHLLSSLPLFDISIHRRWVFLALWAMSTLVALGADAWLQHRDRRLPAALGGALLLTASIVLILVWPTLVDRGLSAAYLARETIWLLAPLALAGLLFLVGPRGRRTATATLVAVLALGLVQRAGEAHDRFPTLERDDAYPHVPLLDAIEDSDTPWRFTGVGHVFPGNLGSIYGLEDIRGYQPMMLRNLRRTFHLWPSQRSVFFNRVHRLGLPFLDLLGVRWAFARADHGSPPGWSQVAVDGNFALLENSQAMPRAFVPRRVEIDLRPRQLLGRMKRARGFHHVAWLHTGAVPRGEVGAQENATEGTVTARRDGHGLRLETSLADDAWVVVTEPSWDGWRARLDDGSPLEIIGANIAFLAVRVPAGEQTITMRYRPDSFLVGRSISFATLGALILAALVRFGLRRRRA